MEQKKNTIRGSAPWIVQYENQNVVLAGCFFCIFLDTDIIDLETQSLCNPFESKFIRRF